MKFIIIFLLTLFSVLYNKKDLFQSKDVGKFRFFKNIDLIKCESGHYLILKTISKTDTVIKQTMCFEMPGYENVTLYGNSGNIVSLHFSSSSFVATIDVKIEFSANDNVWKITGAELYDPNRMDYDSKIEECKTLLNIRLEEFTSNIESVQGKILDDKSDCKYSYNISRSFNEIHQYYKTDDVNERYSGIGRIQAYLERYPLTPNNLSKYNDIGYFLEQKGLYHESVYLLNKVITKFPNRTPAYLNFGDAYWELKDHVKAKQAYNTYITLMKKSGKEAKIPKRVYERVK